MPCAAYRAPEHDRLRTNYMTVYTPKSASRDGALTNCDPEASKQPSTVLRAFGTANQSIGTRCYLVDPCFMPPPLNVTRVKQPAPTRWRGTRFKA